MIAVVVLLAAMLLRPVHGQDPASQPLLQASDFSYLGSFAVADANGDESVQISYGGNALSVADDGQSIWFGCHDWYKKLGRVSIVPVGQTAKIVTPCTTIPGDVAPGGVETNLGGTMPWLGRLIVTKYVYYDAGFTATSSHAAGKPDLTGFTAFQRVGGDILPGRVGGYMVPVPAEWRSLIGYPALTGQCCLAIIGRTSFGPSIGGFDPAKVGTQNPVPFTQFVAYPEDSPLGSGKNEVYNLTSTIKGAIWVPGTRSVVFIGKHGLGTVCYGEPAECNDPWGYKGYHAYPYRMQAWGYDANDFVAVKNGTKTFSQVKPYAVWEIPGFSSDKTVDAIGAAYDPASKRLYLTTAFGSSPRVHVLSISAGTSTPPPPPPTEICGNGIDDDGDGEIDEGCQVTPPPSTVNVSTVAQLQAAIAGLSSGQTVVIAAGTYQLATPLSFQGQSNIVIKGATGNRDDVVIKGAGMTGDVTFGFWDDNVNGLTIQDLTIRDMSQHLIINNAGTRNVVLRNLHLVDAGDQFVKNNPSATGGVSNGLLEDSLLEYSTVAPDSYTNGLDVHHATGWVVRGNTFRNFRTAAGPAGPAVLIWNASSGAVVERNTFIGNYRDVFLGLDPTKPGTSPVSNAALTDHADGQIANNFIVRIAGQQGDAAIGVFDSPRTKVLSNSILLRGTYANAIEYRFPRTTGVEIRNNLADGRIAARDGATGTVTGNVTNAQVSWFAAPDKGDLHLQATATAAIDKAVGAVLATDFDGETRPMGSAADVGADERQATLPPPAVDCKPGTTWTMTSAGPWLPAVCQADGQQTQQQVWTRSGDVPAQNGGAACSSPTETRTAQRSCTYVPPPSTLTIPGTVTRIDQQQVMGVTFYTIWIQTPFGTVSLGPWPGLKAPGMSRPLQVGDDWTMIWGGK